MSTLRTKTITDIGKAVYIYYSNIELYPVHIKELFGCCGSTATRLMKQAKKYAVENNCPALTSRGVCPEVAYKAWGLDINDLESRLKKLQKLNMGGVINATT